MINVKLQIYDKNTDFHLQIDPIFQSTYVYFLYT